jgi:tetratricopeptide (TPR) repeat protein
MNLPIVLDPIEQLIGQGNIEQALGQLVALLDSDPKYSELAQIARVNQSDYYQLKAQTIKGVISTEEARLATNQITNNVLQVVNRLETGKLTLADATFEPSGSQAWRYYVAGGIIALATALILWQLFGAAPQREEACPAFSGNLKYKVMILPFVQTGKDTATNEPAVDIADGLDVLINKTVGFMAGVRINKEYDIRKKYPSFDEADGIARDCNVQMVVWGKINQSAGAGYKLDVRYKLIEADRTISAGDTTLSNLLRPKNQGEYYKDLKAVTNFLYLVLANYAYTPVASTFYEETEMTADINGYMVAKGGLDTTFWLEVADNLTHSGDTAEAITTYSKVLAASPANRQALQKRAALLYATNHYEEATFDLKAAAPEAENAAPDLLKIRVDALLKSGKPEQAKKDLKVLERKSKSGTWIMEKNKEVRDSTEALEKRRDDMEKKASVRPNDPGPGVEAGKANLGLGDPDRALKNANKVIRQNPRNAAAVEIAVEALIEKEDTVTARKTLEQADKRGVRSRNIEKWRAVVKPLKTPDRE